MDILTTTTYTNKMSPLSPLLQQYMSEVYSQNRSLLFTQMIEKRSFIEAPAPRAIQLRPFLSAYAGVYLYTDGIRWSNGAGSNRAWDNTIRVGSDSEARYALYMCKC